MKVLKFLMLVIVVVHAIFIGKFCWKKYKEYKAQKDQDTEPLGI